jgi:membrane protein
MFYFFDRIKLMRKYFDALVSGFLIFRRKRVGILAAASSFYIILGFIPLSLLVIRALGIALGDMENPEARLFDVFKNLYPEINTQFLIKIQKLVEGPLYATPKLTLLNLVFLIFASLSFTSSIWTGLAIITQDRAKSLWVKFKSILIITVTVLFLIVMLGIPPFLRFVGAIAKDNFLISLIKNNFPESINVLNYLLRVEFGLKFLVQSNFIPFILFLVYFTFLYAYFFHWKIKLREAFFGALIFVFALSLGRFGFYIYFNTFRKTLENNYGDYYSIFVSLIWIFLVMVFFFYGACICFILEEPHKKQEK